MRRLSTLLLTALAAVPAFAIDVQDTRLVDQPTVHGEMLAFAYDHDLWLASRTGGVARRLTNAPGSERMPRFSPDGRWLAFSADYGDNLDVYVMPATGGEPRRLTWHPGADVVRGFSADGSAVLYESQEGVFTRRLSALYTVPIAGGVPTRLPVPSGSKAALSADGRTLAYTPLADQFRQWKNYRGGTQSRIWLLDMGDLSVKEVAKPAGGSNDTDPMWVNGTLYFNSDRNGEFNLFRYDASTGAATQVTTLGDFPVRMPTPDDAGGIVFEQAGYLHRLDTASGTVERIPVSAVSDLLEARPRQASDVKWIREVDASPDLKRMVLNYRGEIVTVPADKGDPRQLTHTPGANEHSPVWSPDGRSIAWFSDLGGEYELFVGAQDGRGEPRRYPLEGAGAYDRPQWSPDGKYIAYRDNSQSLWVTELANGRHQKVAAEPVYSPLNLMSANWSPDSRWLAYTVQNAGLIQTVYAWSVQSGQTVQITDGMSEMLTPVFDPQGEFLYVLASTDAGPLKDWFSQISLDNAMRFGLYAVTLRADGPDPVPPLSDEVAISDGDAAKAEDKTEDKAAAPIVRIDADGIGDRIVALPAGEGTRHSLRVGAAGEIWFIETRGNTSFGAFGGPGELKRFKLSDRETKTVAADVEAFRLSRDGKRIAWQVGQDWFVADVADELPKGKGQLALGRVSVRVEPRAEWAQILDEAWRINRDWFYADNYHGADWPAMRQKYRAFLPHLATRNDLDHVIQMMLSELAVGHSYIAPGDEPFSPERIKVGLLGADYEVVGDRYRFKRVLGGLNWNPALRAPLRTPGVNVREGEFLLAVDGVPLRAPTSVYAPFEHRAGRQVRLTVGPNADGRGSREVIVVPVEDESQLRYLDWVEGNQRYVTEKSGGRLAYVHVPDTAGGGHTAFKRYFYPQSDRAGLIIDERFNGGGLIADYYIDILRRPFIARWVMRYGDELVSPRGAILGPKVMITDELAGSGGDLLPWMFKRFELGTVVGKRTWGGLVGILGFPTLVDGGQVTAPNLAILTEDGFSVENEGVAPHIEVEQWPAEVAAGRDPQLDRAIAVALEELERNPRATPTRPPFPVRAAGTR